MQLRTIKTTVVLSPAFLQRLKAHARRTKRSMSSVIEEELETVFQKREKQKLEKMYDALEDLQGIGSPSVSDASQTIDETLYGNTHK